MEIIVSEEEGLLEEAEINGSVRCRARIEGPLDLNIVYGLKRHESAWFRAVHARVLHEFKPMRGAYVLSEV